MRNQLLDCHYLPIYLLGDHFKGLWQIPDVHLIEANCSAVPDIAAIAIWEEPSRLLAFRLPLAF
jgi:hypothetical protein